MSLLEIRARIKAAAQANARRPEDITLIAVSKVQPVARVRATLAQGQYVYGENYVQETQRKWPELLAENQAAGRSVPILHMIGPLQSNKARVATQLFDAIHTLDRPSLAQKLAHLAQERGTSPDLFIQVNTGEEPQKAGIMPKDLSAFITQCQKLDLPICGLMCIPPDGPDSAQHFGILRDMAHQHGLTQLSMGMSGDFEAAIAYGATHIRVGSALFGARTPKT
jgi:pyridoxal phosphate enzyme (YggS family)